MSEPGDRLTRRYRELAREEPPHALDDTILAASRRAVGAGPQRVRSGVSRWAGPVSIAAVLVLGIGVSLRMQLEKPGIETSIPAQPSGEYPLPQAAEPAPPPAPAAPPEKPAAPPPLAKVPTAAVTKAAPAAPQAQSVPAPRAKVSEPQPEVARQEPMQDQAKPPARRLEAPAGSVEAPATNTTAITTGAPPSAQPAPMRAKREGFAADSAARESRAIGALAEADPARELERIARLREAGRHAEADRALEELRRRHPDYRIPEAMWERVKPR